RILCRSISSTVVPSLITLNTTNLELGPVLRTERKGKPRCRAPLRLYVTEPSSRCDNSSPDYVSPFLKQEPTTHVEHRERAERDWYNGSLHARTIVSSRLPGNAVKRRAAIWLKEHAHSESERAATRLTALVRALPVPPRLAARIWGKSS